MSGAHAPLLEALSSHIEQLPPAVAEEALRAQAAFSELGWPHRKSEAWRYTSLRSLAATPWTVARRAESAWSTEPAPAIEGLHALLLRVVDGVVTTAPDASTAGLAIQRWVPTSDPSSWKDGVAGLRDAAITDQLHLSVDASWNAAVPLVLDLVTTRANTLSAPHFQIRVAAGATLHLVQRQGSSTEESTLSLPSIRLDLEEGAEVHHHRIVEGSAGTQILSSITVDVPSGATYRSTCLALGGRLFREELETALLGEGSHAALHAVSLLEGNNAADHNTLLDHRVPDATSEQVYRYVLRERGHGVFHGRIMVHQDAQRTHAEQMNQTLLLSEDARIDTRPQLEIFADDVTCTHGATVGQLSNDELFYLTSRGVAQEAAQVILLRGFALELLQSIEHEGVRELMIAQLDAHLASL